MRPTSTLLIAVVLFLGAAGPAPGAGAEAVKTYARGDYAGVVKLLEPAYRSGSANIQQRLILARAQLHLGRTDDALGVLKSVLASDRENPEANALTGKALHDRGEHAEALKYLQQAYRLKQDPATAGALGKCYHALKQTAKAKVYLERALADDIRDPGNSFLLGEICLGRGLGALAEKYFLMAEEAGLRSAELYLLLGRAYLLQRKYVGPVLLRRLDTPAKPGDVVDDRVVLGKADGVADRYKVAARYCALYEGLRLSRASPQSADAQYMLAAGWLAAGDADLAARHLDVLLQREKRTPRAAELRVRLLLAKTDYAALDQALTAAKNAKVFDAAKLAGYYYQAGMMRRAEGNRDEAVRLLKAAETHAPASAPILRSLAALYLGTGRGDEARAYYARLVERFPDADDIDELRNTLRVLQEKKGGAR